MWCNYSPQFEAADDLWVKIRNQFLHTVDVITHPWPELSKPLLVLAVPDVQYGFLFLLCVCVLF